MIETASSSRASASTVGASTEVAVTTVALVVRGGWLVGTITFHESSATSGCPWYDRPEVASFHQFGVEPGRRGRGIGSRLLERVEERARETGAGEVALDTAEPARRLRRFYERRGYRFVGFADREPTNYRSVHLSKALPPSEEER